MPRPKQLVHTDWFDHVLQTLGDLRQVEEVLSKELYRLACYADLVARVPGSPGLRSYQTEPLLRADGQVVRVVIYFVLRSDDTVELQHIESIDAAP